MVHAPAEACPLTRASRDDMVPPARRREPIASVSEEDLPCRSHLGLGVMAAAQPGHGSLSAPTTRAWCSHEHGCCARGREALDGDGGTQVLFPASVDAELLPGPLGVANTS